MRIQLFVLALAALTLAAPGASAQTKTKLAQEAAEYVLQKFGKEAVKDGASALARRIEQAAVAHGDEVFQAVRLVGPRALPLIEEGGVHAKQVVRLLAAHGEEGAVFVASRPRAMQLFLEHGEEAAAALVKSRGVALPAVESLGKPAIRAFQALGSPQNARRLAMMAGEGGELARIGRTPEVLAVIERYGDKAMQFIWNNKGALAVATTLAAFLAEPEPFLNGARDLSKAVAENVVKPLADVPAIVAREGAAEVARKTNWTLVFLVIIAPLVLLAAAKWRLLAPVVAALQAARKRQLPHGPPAPPPAAPATGISHNLPPNATAPAGTHGEHHSPESKERKWAPWN
jgi:hypothetical protein